MTATIKAKISNGERSVRLVFDGGLQIMTLGEEDALSREILDAFKAIMTPGTVPFMNPLKGGIYYGFDPMDALEVRDALLWIDQQGYKVTFEDVSIPELEVSPPPAIVPDDADQRESEVPRPVDRRFEVED